MWDVQWLIGGGNLMHLLADMDSLPTGYFSWQGRTQALTRQEAMFEHMEADGLNF